MVNRVSSNFPKGGHSATETELKIIRWNVTETLTPKQATDNHNETAALGRPVMNYWGGGLN